MTLEIKKLGDFTAEQRKDCLMWLYSDNVVIDSDQFGNTCFRAQCNQYMSAMTIGEAIHYWWKEYGKYQDYSDIEE